MQTINITIIISNIPKLYRQNKRFTWQYINLLWNMGPAHIFPKSTVCISLLDVHTTVFKDQDLIKTKYYNYW